MNNKLTKELKGGGFPFTEHDDDFLDELNGGLGYSVTLSELIEECGERFALHMMAEEMGWKAWKINSSRDMTKPHADVLTEGKTPSEAVAKLWLSLNKKV